MKVLILLVSFIFSLSSAYSCTCDYSLADDLKESDLILIVEIERSFDGDIWTDDLFFSKTQIDSSLKVSGYHVQAKVLKTYKGILKSETINIKGDRFFSCAQEFKIGGIYLVFLVKEKKEYLTSVCHHNFVLEVTDSFLEIPEIYFEKNN